MKFSIPLSYEARRRRRASFTISGFFYTAFTFYFAGYFGLNVFGLGLALLGLLPIFMEVASE